MNQGKEDNGESVRKMRLMATEARSGMAGRMTGAGIPAEKSKDFSASSRRLVARLRPHRARMTVVLAFAVMSVVLSVLGPRLLGNVTNLVVAGAIRGSMDFEELTRHLVQIIMLYLSSAVLAWFQARVLASVVQATMRQLRSEAEHKVHRLPLSYADSQPRGDLLSRVTNDVDNIAQSLQQTLSQMLTSILTLIGTTVMMFTVSPLLAAVAFVIFPFSIIATKTIAARSRPRFIAQWSHTGSLNAQVEESFSGHALVKVFGQRGRFEETFEQTNTKLFDAAFGAQFTSGIIQPMMAFIGNLNYVVVAVVGGFRVAAGAISIGDVQAFIQYSRQFTQPLTQLASMANVFQSGVASAERVFEFLDAPEEEDIGTDLTVDEGRVEFKHVAFQYQPDRPLISDLSLVARPGHTVAIVGPTGAGKTTLVNLLMRFYELNAGQILIDGTDIATVSRDSVRREIAMVLQDTWLFHGTIRDNIMYGNSHATEEAFFNAVRATYVDRFVHSLPEGYHTVLDDEATSLSAGEKQLLTIARAFLADPTILVLDEATSSVDTRTEVLVQRAMAALRSSRTSFVIAHRLSTIRDADTILVMEDGAIVEQGSHAELLARRGPYFRLYQSQFVGANQ